MKFILRARQLQINQILKPQENLFLRFNQNSKMNKTFEIILIETIRIEHPKGVGMGEGEGGFIFTIFKPIHTSLNTLTGRSPNAS